MMSDGFNFHCKNMSHLMSFNCKCVFTIIVRIEFSPVVEIGVSNGHNLLQETTYEGLTLSYT